MNKKNGIIIGVLALIVTMMVGYAIFSEVITINGTATAKGDFDMTITCQTGLNESLVTIEDLMPGYGPESGYKNDTCSATDNTVSFSADLEYPGAKRWFTVKVTNTGSIDSVLKVSQENSSDKTDITSEHITCSDDDNDGVISDSECKTGTNFTTSLLSQTWDGGVIIGFEKNDGTLINVINSEETAYSDFFTNNGNSILLNQGESVYFAYIAMMPLGYGANSSDPTNFYLKSYNNVTYKFSQPTS